MNYIPENEIISQTPAMETGSVDDPKQSPRATVQTTDLNVTHTCAHTDTHYHLQMRFSSIKS